MAKYTLRDDAGSTRTVEADSDEDAGAQAIEWALHGSYDGVKSTIWIDVRVENEAGEDVDRVTARIDPDEPSCVSASGEHDWQAPFEIVGGLRENPGVRGKGGGVVIQECCMQCGCERMTDTWAQRPDTGKQGLESVSYTAGKFAVEVAALRSE